MTVDLSTRYLGLRLRNPIVASASPATSTLENLQQLEASGAGAVVLPSLFEEQIEHDAMQFHQSLEAGSGAFAEASQGYLPEMERYNTGSSSYLELLSEAKSTLGIPVIPSLNGVSTGGWTLYARLFEDAGADAIELNIYYVAADPDLSPDAVEDRYLRLVTAVREATSVPLAVKIGPYFSAVGHTARRLVDAGADGLVLFNRFYQPDIDLGDLTVKPRIVLSSSAEMRLVLRWIAILHGRVDASLAGTTGVHTSADVIKLLLAGADVTMTASALLQHGLHYVGELAAGLQQWLEENDYESVDQARGSLSQLHAPDPEAFERANYMKTLVSYSRPIPW